jgi:hypothetical protein
MTISQTGTVLGDVAAKKRIKDIIDNNQIIKTRINAFIAQLDASPNLSVLLQEIEQNANLTQAQKEQKKLEKKRDVAIFSEFLTNNFFNSEVRRRL